MRNPEGTSDRPTATPYPNGRLDSWKEIACYLKRGLRTVRRWEQQETLPVHRHLHGKQGTVYAFKEEIDTWLKGRSATANPGVPPGRDNGNPAAERAAISPDKGLSARPIVIAVLPLKSLSDNPNEKPLADGLAEAILSKLSQVDSNHIRTVAFSTVLQYLQSGRSIAQLGKDLGVDYFLEAGGRIQDGHMRLITYVVSARDQVHLWADSYELELPSTLSIQLQFADQLMNNLSTKLGLPTATRDQSPPQSTRRKAK